MDDFPDKQIYRFAEFELHVEDGLLKSEHSTVRLQEKPLRLLCALLDHPQRLVTRNELRQRMWDARTVVDFEQGINVAIKKVRGALGDSADQPRFIETLARKGYRFLVPVDVVCTAPIPNADPPDPPAGARPDSSQAASWRGGPATRPAAPADVTGYAKGFSRNVLAALLGLSVCAVAAWLALASHQAPLRTLAILPLRDLSPAADQRDFADAVTDEVTDRLEQVLPYRVISRGSALHYRQGNPPLAEIAAQLGVDGVLEGSVSRTGDRVRISLRLTDTRSRQQLWSQSYDRSLAEMPALEADVSEAVLRRLGGTAAPGAPMAEALRTLDAQAYDWVLMGRYHLNKRTLPDLRQAADYFQRAIARAPDYAPAHAALATTYSLMPMLGPLSLHDYTGLARTAALRAVQLDDRLAEAHIALAFIGLNSPTTWSTVEPELRKALMLDPNNARAHQLFAFQRLFSGHVDEALHEIGLARELDPLDDGINANEGHFLYVARRFSDARSRLVRAAELSPLRGRPHSTLALVELESGNRDAALREAQAALELDPGNPRTLGECGYVMARAGHPERAEKLLAELKDLKQGTVAPVYQVLLELGLGERDRALETLELGIANGSPHPTALIQWHPLQELSQDPRLRKRIAALALAADSSDPRPK